MTSRTLVWYDKMGAIHYEASTQALLDQAALRVLKERVENGYIFWPDGAAEKAQAILDAEDGKAALDFLMDRRDHEYEGISMVIVR